MERAAATGNWSGPPPGATGKVLPWAEDRWPGATGDTSAWVFSLQPETRREPEPSEEQQLQISRELVDMQRTTHHLREQYEGEIFQLRSEVLRLESRVLELELQAHRAKAGEQPSNHRLQTQPQDFKPLESRPQKPANAHLGEAEQALETHVAALGQQLQGAREEARTAEQQLAVRAQAVSSYRGQLRQAEAENSWLQAQLKRMSEEHAVRLQHCARALAGYADGPGQASPLRALLEATLEDIRATHRSREQQLARAAHAYRKRLVDLSRRHEELLAIHSVWQAPCQMSAEASIPCKAVPRAATRGPQPAGPPVHLAAELRPPWEKTKLRTQLQTLQAQKQPREASLGASKPQSLDGASWAQIHQRLQDFCRGTQAELEQERSLLLARATAAEAQLSELQEYVDQHLGRYKLEILTLRKLLGTGDHSKVGAV